MLSTIIFSNLSFYHLQINCIIFLRNALLFSCKIHYVTKLSAYRMIKINLELRNYFLYRVGKMHWNQGM